MPLQVWIMPYIETNAKMFALYKADEALFWIRLWDPNDILHQIVDCLIIDGAHRRHVSKAKLILSMRSLWLRPTTSTNELVHFLSIFFSDNRCDYVVSPDNNVAAHILIVFSL